MADSMVTGRMTQAKKAAGNRVLASLGLNASQAINQLYDHLIDQRSLPFGNAAEHTHPVEERAAARAFVRSIPRKNRFSGMDDDQIKLAKLKDKGFHAAGGDA